MKRGLAKYVFVVASWQGCAAMLAQQASPTPTHAWHSNAESAAERELTAAVQPRWTTDPEKVYTLLELIDLAESHNPDTRVSWERARQRAADLKIARSAYFPTLTAAVYAASLRQASLSDAYFHRQTIAAYEPTLHVDYLLFDLGGRAGEVDIAKANLLIANLAFNDIHRRLIYQMSSAYFHLLNAYGQQEATTISLRNAEAVEADAKERLQQGLATRPDLLEAIAARAQAEVDLQSAVGASAIASAHLVTIMGLPSETVLKVQPLSEIDVPNSIPEPLDEQIEKALQQRPEMLEVIGRMRIARGIAKQARSDYFPKVEFSGDGGLARAYGQQDLNAGHYAEGEVWNAEFNLRWTLFNGARREETIAAANAQKRAAIADLHALRDQVDEEVFDAYTNLQTALKQQQAAAVLLDASAQSYEAALESRQYGLRSELDVIATQKTLAQARSEDVTARTDVLLGTAELAFRTGDLIQSQTVQGRP